MVVKLIAVSFSKLATPKKSQIRKKLQEYCKEYISGKNKDEIIKRGYGQFAAIRRKGCGEEHNKDGKA